MSPTNAIPRILHQTYFTRDLPPPIAANVARLRASNANWAYRFYDDADVEAFIASRYGAALLTVYRRINPAYGAARADLFRYLLMYCVGGVYLDIKSNVTRPLDEIAEEARGYRLAKWDNGPSGRHPNWGLHEAIADVPGGEFQQWHIIATPGHRFLAATIDAVLANIKAYRPWRDDVGRDGVIKLTGPVAYTRAITPLLSGDDYSFDASDADVGLVYSVLPGVDHKRLFVRHYTVNLDPVVEMTGALAPMSTAYSGWRRFRRLAGRLRRLRPSPGKHD